MPASNRFESIEPEGNRLWRPPIVIVVTTERPHEGARREQ